MSYEIRHCTGSFFGFFAQPTTYKLFTAMERNLLPKGINVMVPIVESNLVFRESHFARVRMERADWSHYTGRVWPRKGSGKNEDLPISRHFAKCSAATALLK